MASLDELKPLDRVAVLSRGTAFKIAVVSHVTTNFIVVDDSRYRKGDGTLVTNDPWSTTSIDIPTDNHMTQIAKAGAIKRLNKVRWEDLPLEILRSVLTLLDHK